MNDAERAAWFTAQYVNQWRETRAAHKGIARLRKRLLKREYRVTVAEAMEAQARLDRWLFLAIGVALGALICLTLRLFGKGWWQCLPPQ